MRTLLLSLIFAAAAHAQQSWNTPFPPHKVIGNVYFIGSKELASFLITTPEGHILVNSDFESTVPLLRSNVEKLGFKFSFVIFTDAKIESDHFRESGFGKNPVWWAFVAEWNGTVAGFALYYIRYSTWKGQRMYLEDLLVTEKSRGRGIGSKLMEQLILEAREKKFSGIMWQVLDWNTPAIEFYKKFDVSFDPEWINCTIDLSQEK